MPIPKQGVCYHTARRPGSYNVTVPQRGLVRLEDEFERLKRMGFWVNPKLLDARLALFREGWHEPETAAGQDQERHSQKRRSGTATEATSNERPQRSGCSVAPAGAS